ncbi:helix-turn-helix transcriptional regulator [Anaerobium acetethylicum]|uniref:AraC-type DNA-binding protein n=1 Tax=Anaerobium acetethylicum TaxID=1619234 RepID=A0A1D3TWN1_9FIRM|nr:AraC family transcriptional regulator [Anaerobium acetethylicum]SCP98670.1 AraC-type DNA-binding protein [Anaerobium acetethylicum]
MYMIDFCGYNIHNPDNDIIYRPNGSSSYLFLLVLAPMNFEINGQEVLAKPGACMLYTPGFAQKYQACTEFYNSFVHFIPDSEQDVEAEYGIPLNTIFYPEGIDEINWYIRKIHREYLEKALHYENQLDAYVRQLLVYMDREYRSISQKQSVKNSMYAEFQSLRLQMLSYCEEDWPVERMCRIMNLEKSQLYAGYKKLFYTTPKAELIQARIDKAKYLMTNEALQISQVAQKSGFHDIYHFSRCFKKICGCAPSQYGKMDT